MNRFSDWMKTSVDKLMINSKCVFPYTANANKAIQTFVLFLKKKRPQRSISVPTTSNTFESFTRSNGILMEEVIYWISFRLYTWITLFMLCFEDVIQYFSSKFEPTVWKYAQQFFIWQSRFKHLTIWCQQNWMLETELMSLSKIFIFHAESYLGLGQPINPIFYFS